MQRVKQGTPQTIANDWRNPDGSLADPGTTTVTITAQDGSTVVAAGTATGGAGAAQRTFALTTTHTALLDRLTVLWSTANFGIDRSYVEIPGDFLVPLSALDPHFPDSTDAGLASIRTAAEQRLEDECHRAFVPRYAYESKSVYRRLRLTHAPVREIRSLTLNGTAYTSDQVEALFYSNGALLWPGLNQRTTFSGRVSVGYEHGDDYPPEAIREACVLAAKETYPNLVAADARVDGRVIRREADGQAVTYISPSASGPFIDPTLREIVRGYQRQVGG